MNRKCRRTRSCSRDTESFKAWGINICGVVT